MGKQEDVLGQGQEDLGQGQDGGKQRVGAGALWWSLQQVACPHVCVVCTRVCEHLNVLWCVPVYRMCVLACEHLSCEHLLDVL